MLMSFITDILDKFRGRKKTEQSNSDSTVADVKEESPKIAAKSNKERLVCPCGYKFSVEAKKYLKIVCPWCGKAID